ncbi:MAG: hypothetical protein IKA02_02150 [Clostridia bacterium]|nr:hypothetical protein [Clostridia bacterium]
MAKIEVGRMALRAPDGTFLPSQPIYRDVADETVTVTVDDEEIIFPYTNAALALFDYEMNELRKQKAKK